LLAVVFAFDKFRSYLIGSKVYISFYPQVFACKERGETKVDKMGLTSPRVWFENSRQERGGESCGRPSFPHWV